MLALPVDAPTAVAKSMFIVSSSKGGVPSTALSSTKKKRPQATLPSTTTSSCLLGPLEGLQLGGDHDAVFPSLFLRYRQGPST